MFLLVLLAATLELHYGREMLKLYRDGHPMDRVGLYRSNMSSYSFLDEVTLYDGYTAEDGLEVPNDYYAVAAYKQQGLSRLLHILYGITLGIFGICCLYLLPILKTELYYRKKELGYLQIFGLSPARIRRASSPGI